MNRLFPWLSLLAVATLLIPSALWAGTVPYNIALGKPTEGTEAFDYPTANAVDGLLAIFSHGDDGIDSVWRVNLEQAYDLSAIEVVCRYDFPDRTNWATLQAFGADGTTQIGSDILMSDFNYDDDPLINVYRVAYDNSGAGWNGVQYIQIGGAGSSVQYLHVAELFAYTEVEAFDGFISGVTATADSYYPSFAAIPGNAVNSLGMVEDVPGDPNAMHTAFFEGLWHTDFQPADPWISFDLGGTHDLGNMLIWNLNENVYNDRGFKEVLIETSTDGVTFTPIDDSNGDDAGNYTIPIAPTEETVGYQLNVALDGITASHVRISALSNYGSDYWGLSEVRFYEPGSIVDPPSDIPGDANRDGIVNDADATILATNWQTAADATWAMGDFNNDGAVDDSDATILATNWQSTGSSAAAVPEPGTVALLLAGLISLCLYRRRA